MISNQMFGDSVDWLDLVPVALIVVSLDGRQIKRANEAAATLSGYGTGELKSMAVGELVTPDANGPNGAGINSNLDGIASVGRFRLRKRNGENITMAITTRLIDFEGEQHLLCACQDVSRHAQAERDAEATLQEAEATKRQAETIFRRAELLIAADRDLLMVVDPKTFVVRWTNMRLVWALGLTRDMVNGADFPTLLDQTGEAPEDDWTAAGLGADALAQDCRQHRPGLPRGLRRWARENAGDAQQWTTVAIPHTDPKNGARLLIIVIRPWTDQTADLTDSDLIFEVANRIRLEGYQGSDTPKLFAKQVEAAHTRLDVLGRMIGFSEWQFDIENRLLSWSSDFTDILGVDKSVRQLPVETYIDYVHEEDRQYLLNGLNRVIAGDAIKEDFAYRLKDGNGRTRILQGKAERVVLNGRDTLIGMIWDSSKNSEDEAEANKRETLARLANRIANVGGWHLDISARQIEWSRQLSIIHDLPGTRKLGLSLGYEFVCPESRPHVERALEDCIQNGQEFDIISRNRSAKGRVFDARIIGSAERDADGKITGVSGALQDISTLRELERRVDALQDRFTSTLESMQDGFVSLQSNLRIDYLNSAAQRLLQLQDTEALNQELCSLLQEFDRSLLEARLQECLASQQPATFEIGMDDDSSILRLSCRPSGHGLDLFIRNVTEDNKRERVMQQSQKLEAVGQLTGGIAHDFNNMLTIIIGNLDLLLEKISDPSAKKLAAVAATTADRAAQLTSRLLSFSRKQSLKPRPIFVEDALRTAMPLLSKALDGSAELSVDLDQDALAIDVDPHQFESALLNLVLNARDAMGAAGEVRIGIRRMVAAGHDIADSHVCIFVADNGRGMDAATVSKVFEPFFTTKGEGLGTGLGLSMVYGFVKQSGGQIEIDSLPGKGTTVNLLFPEIDGGEVETSNDISNKPIPRGQGEVVLLVEDEPFLRSFVEEQLRALGYVPLAAGTAEEALRILREGNDIDLLFTDVILGHSENGYALAQQALELRPGLKVLYTSGYATDVLASTGRLAPDVKLLSKPYSRAKLAIALGKALTEDR